MIVEMEFLPIILWEQIITWIVDFTLHNLIMLIKITYILMIVKYLFKNLLFIRKCKNRWNYLKLMVTLCGDL